jgi:7,8-dihydropterin-6-yl-methyl-4-(beta-D-ribofuranosyl)aminobenzene 5'-phosphate synthase
MSSLHMISSTISRVVVSHWHSDHTGGLLSFLQDRINLKAGPCIIDIHPDRPLLRGIAPGPKYDKVVCGLPQDPTIEQIKDLGGTIETHADGHCVSDGTVWVSGEIPRVTHFEPGVLGGMRWIEEQGNVNGCWTAESVSQPVIMVWSAS